MSELCADASWLPKDRRDCLKEIIYQDMPKLKYANEASAELTGETRMPVEFRPCPDCGCEEYPLFDREEEMIVGPYKKVVLNPVRAYCIRCGWTTALHKNVKECAKEWNEAEV